MIKIDVIAFHDSKGNIRPYRIRLLEEDEYTVIDIKRLLHTNKIKDITSYKCEILINNMLKNITLEFHRMTLTWYLKSWIYSFWGEEVEKELVDIQQAPLY